MGKNDFSILSPQYNYDQNKYDQEEDPILEIMSIRVYSEKIKNSGEDAPPIGLFNLGDQDKNQSDVGLIAVADGMGGAGSESHIISEQLMTEARIAARVVINTLKLNFKERVSPQANAMQGLSDDVIRGIKDDIDIELNEFNDKLKGQKPPSALKSKLTRKFPTTLAAIYYFPRKNESKYTVIWAGDSRAYKLEPSGLTLVTDDDVKDKSESKSSNQDSPLSNFISLDKKYALNVVSYTVSHPVVFIVATDGCYGFFKTQAHFENCLLQTLMKSNSKEDWGQHINMALAAISGDDFSMQIACIGWRDIEHVKRAFSQRHANLMEEINMLSATEAKLSELEFLLGQEKKKRADIIRRLGG